MSSGHYGDISESVKNAYLKEKINEIESSYTIKKNSAGSIEFYSKETDELVRTGKTNSASSILDIALMNSDFKNNYSEKKVTKNPLKLGQNKEQGKGGLSKAQVIEKVNTMNLNSKAYYSELSRLLKENGLK